jgi:hypothetical protein
MRIVIPAVLAIAVWIPCRAAARMDITSCGQVVPAGEQAVLRADLDCPPGVSGPTVTLGDDASLRMNGHAIRGGTWLSCTRCTITGPGEISGAADCAIRITANPTPPNAGLVARDLYIHDNGFCAIAMPGSVRLRNVVIGGDTPYGLVELLALRGSDVHITNSPLAIGCNANGTGPDACGENGENCPVHLRRLVVQDGGVGIFGCNLFLRDSVLEGNQFDDLVTAVRPHLLRTRCDHSRGPDGGWGVCAGDARTGE